MINTYRATITKVFLGCDNNFGWILSIIYVFGNLGGHYYIPLDRTEKIVELFKVVGVKDINEFKGKEIRVRGDNLLVYSIGNIEKDLWIKLD